MRINQIKDETSISADSKIIVYMYKNFTGVHNLVIKDQKKEKQVDEIKEVVNVMVNYFDTKIKDLKEKKDNELNKITDEKVKEFMAYWIDEEMKELEEMKERITSIGKTSIREFIEGETEDTKRKGR
jgi:biopolymer transport protein ExbB/TolQ